MVVMDGGNPIRESANRMFADGLQLADTLSAAGGLPPTTLSFPNTSLGRQMQEVARLIRVRSQMGAGRQVFFCSIGGFDTHSAQLGQHSNLMRDLSQAMAAFAYATLDLGVAGNRRVDALDLRRFRVDRIVEGERPFQDAASDLAALGHLAERGCVYGGWYLGCHGFDGRQDRHARRSEPDLGKEVYGILDDVPLHIEIRCDVDGGIGNEKGLRIGGHVHDEDMADPAPSAQTCR